MDVRDDGGWTKPIPSPDATARPFWEAAARGELRIQRCPACGHRQHYPRALCTRCGTAPGLGGAASGSNTPEAGGWIWEQASGRGSVHTFTVIRQFGGKPFRDELPYVVAMIELDEGVRMMGNVTDCAPEAVRIGLRVEAYAIRAEEGIAIPQWRPLAADERG